MLRNCLVLFFLLVLLLQAAFAQEVPAEETLVGIGDNWAYFKGTQEPDSSWNTAGFDDSSWPQGPTPIGYSSDVAYATTLQDMLGGYRSFYARRDFTISHPEDLPELELVLAYDDAFIAYINGQEVARSSSMGNNDPYLHDDLSEDCHDEEDPEETYSEYSLVYPLNIAPGLLQQDNVLAIQVHNCTDTSSDAGLFPVLTAINNRAPTADIAASPTTGEPPLTVNFNGSGSSDDGTIVDYAWSFGDGSSQNSSNPTIQHQYLQEGLYQAELTVTDEEGLTGTDSMVIRLGAAQTYYVAKTGCSDSYPGTEAQPWCTLAKAAGTAVAGDTVLIRAGTYSETLRPANSGSPGNYITYKNYPGETVTITGPSLTPAIDLGNPDRPTPGKSYIIIEGLKVDNVGYILWGVDAHHNIIRNNEFSRDNTSGSSKGGVFFQNGTYNRILNNSISDISGMALPSFILRGISLRETH